MITQYLCKKGFNLAWIKIKSGMKVKITRLVKLIFENFKKLKAAFKRIS
jgi:hypothetical protein